jgi:predicted nucleic acid-binding protein
MTSDLIGLTVFLDANILAKPVTRSLLMFSSYTSDFTIVWSDYVEKEADRRVRVNRATARSVREMAKSELTPTGGRLSRFLRTDPKDRQVLADAVAAEAAVIVTEDVDDFDESELIAVGIAAVNPDLFLAECVTSEAYAEAVRRMAAKMSSPTYTPGQLHARIGRQHPLTLVAHKAAFDAEPDAAVNEPPAILYRGDRCLRCLKVGRHVTLGVCDSCRTA